MCKLKVVNKARDVVADWVTPEKFMAFKRAHGKGSVVIVELHCGEEILVDTVRILKRLLKEAIYNARLLQRVARPPEALDGAGHDVWVAV